MKLFIQEQEEKLKLGKVFQVNIISLQTQHSYWHMTEQYVKFMCETHSLIYQRTVKITIIKFLNFFYSSPGLFKLDCFCSVLWAMRAYIFSAGVESLERINEMNN